MSVATYYQLTKPGLLYGNLIAAAAGFFLAAGSAFSAISFFAMLAGTSGVIASSCVMNNIADSDMDRKMERTKNRAIAKGFISKKSAFAYSALLFLVGFLLLYLYTNITALLAGLVGFGVYVLLYTPLKRKTEHAALVGSVAGAMPPVIGYTTVVQSINTTALLLFCMFVFWQMAHFYAIAIRRRDEYMAAEVPVMSLAHGVFATKIYMVIYAVLFVVAAILLGVVGGAGRVYLTLAGVLCVPWLALVFSGLRISTQNQEWARVVFLYSIVVLMVLCISMSIGAILGV